MRVAFLRRQRAVGIDGDQGRAAALGLLRPCPEMHARGDGVAAPENDELGLIGQFHVDADAAAESDLMAGGARGGADGSIQKAGTEPVEEAHGHRFALHQSHGSRIAVRQNPLRILGRDRRKAAGDGGNGLLPADPLEAPFSLLADAPHGIQQTIGVVGALGVAGNLGAQHAGGGGMRGGAGDLDGDAVPDMHIERAGVRAVMRARALDHGHVAYLAHVAYPVSRIRSMNRSHCASCSRVTNSFGPWACAMSPGPQMTLGTPIFWNRPASVP